MEKPVPPRAGYDYLQIAFSICCIDLIGIKIEFSRLEVTCLLYFLIMVQIQRFFIFQPTKCAVDSTVNIGVALIDYQIVVLQCEIRIRRYGVATAQRNWPDSE